ncbi:N-acetyl sugar amidotransferase [Haliscomenobacter sp.]|uniref:N-acetyl sugar amidotransferase n=1 Tax=Haliscomenobacter sp. TaxID=2717303 RepID=UPI003BAD1EEE
MLHYDEEKLKNSFEANCGRLYQQCKVSVMDTIADPDISFDDQGICNYYYEYQQKAAEGIILGDAGKVKLEEMVKQIKAASKGQQYDCILGLSGGADSTYMACLAKELGLNPLLVHFDYGWNLETAVQNIERTVKVLGFDLYTYVMDWAEFKDLLRAYVKASVLDLDVPADHLIFAALAKVATKHRIKSILKGYNIATEAILPRTWNYNRKFDLINLKNIHQQFGEHSIKSIPKLGYWQRKYYDRFVQLRDYSPLNYIEYNKKEVKKLLSDKLGWIDYGGKHCENIFTRFYQGYILPRKYGIDKRKAHLSTLIFSGQMTKEEAMEEMSNPPYDLAVMKNDYEYVAKKLGFSIEEFDQLLAQPNRDHQEFGNEQKLEQLIERIILPFRTIRKILR